MFPYKLRGSLFDVPLEEEVPRLLASKNVVLVP